MKCYFEFCIYNCESKCRLSSLEINELGMCSECIIIALDKAFLKEEKEKQLQEIENKFTE